MELYTLDREFRDKDVIDASASVIWTERYGEAGDCVLTVEDTPLNRQRLELGTFLASTDSQEVMLLETREKTKEGLLKVSGDSITKFLQHRVGRASGYWNSQSWDIPSVKPGETMAAIILATCMPSVATVSEFPWFGINGYRQIIKGLTFGEINHDGPVGTINVSYGPVYDMLKAIADTYQLGFKMYLEYATDQGYSLKFTAYKGRDLTRTGPDPSLLVQFSPATGSLKDTSSIESMAGYRNVCYAFAPAWVTPSYVHGMGVAYAPGFNPATKNFDRRVMQIYCDDMTVPDNYPHRVNLLTGEDLPPGDPPPGYLLPALNYRAQNALANNNYTRLVDGEVVPQDGIAYGSSYRLGDIVELSTESNELFQRARITEYIRTKDKDGEKAYPTVSVLD